MKNIKFALAAGFLLALAFTFSCSLPDDSGVETSYNYCIRADNTCLTGPFTASDGLCAGQLSNSCPNGSSTSVGGSSSSVTGGGLSSSNGGVVPTISSSGTGGSTYSLDGVWERDDGTIISIYDGKAVFSNILTTSAWKEVEKKGNIKIGDSYWRNITKTGDLTWSYENLVHNGNTYELTGWKPGTITMNSNGQSFTNNVPDTSDPVHTFTKKQ